MSIQEQTRLTDSQNNVENPSTEDTLLLISHTLMGIKYLLQSQGITDTAQRQRIAVDTMVALPANQTVNLAQVAGTAAVVNIGLATAGVQRVVVANDSQIDNTIALLRIAYNGLRSNLIFN